MPGEKEATNEEKMAENLSPDSDLPLSLPIIHLTLNTAARTKDRTL